MSRGTKDRLGTHRSGPSTRGFYALLLQPGIGHRTALALALQHPALDEEALSDVRPDLAVGWQRQLDRAAKLIDRDRVQGIEAVGFFDDAYPAALREIPDPPAMIWVRGALEPLQDRRAVAVVGTRSPSKFGVDAARVVASTAAKHGWTVVSGLAKGIDTMAHEAALDVGGKTVAVLAGGLDVIYPAENKELARRIVTEGGALISESPTGYRPRPASFIARDRLQTALSQVVVICQTGRSGGALHTARFAAMQGRPVFCPIPGEPMTEKSEGLKVLLEERADALCDVFNEWSRSAWLCRRLGDRPLAAPIRGAEGVEQFFVWLDEMATSDPVDRADPGLRATPDEGWWALIEDEFAGSTSGSGWTTAEQRSLFG